MLNLNNGVRAEVLPSKPIDYAGIKSALNLVKKRQSLVVPLPTLIEAKPAATTKDTKTAGIDCQKKRMIGSTGIPTGWHIVLWEQKAILHFQRLAHHTTNFARCCGFVWRSLSGHQKLVYDAVAERARKDPFTDISFRTFEGI